MMKRRNRGDMGRGSVSVSEMLTTPDTSAPLGIGSKHYSVSIPAHLHPVHRLLHVCGAFSRSFLPCEKCSTTRQAYDKCENKNSHADTCLHTPKFVVFLKKKHSAQTWHFFFNPWQGLSWINMKKKTTSIWPNQVFLIFPADGQE